MPSLFEAYITNLGKYNEGELVGETLKFPTSPQAVEALCWGSMTIWASMKIWTN